MSRMPSPTRTCSWRPPPSWVSTSPTRSSSVTVSGTCWRRGGRGPWVLGCYRVATAAKSCSRPAPIGSTRTRVTCCCTSTKSACENQRAEQGTVGGGGAAGRTTNLVPGSLRDHGRSLRGGAAADPDGGHLPRLAGGGFRGRQLLLPRLWSPAPGVRSAGGSLRTRARHQGSTGGNRGRGCALRASAQSHRLAGGSLHHRRHRVRRDADDAGL